MLQRKRLLVVAALIKDGDRILLSQRRADQSFPLCWEFPGGKIEPGESPEAALVREINEELGCDVSVGSIADVVFHAYDDFDLYMLLYRCEITTGTPKAVQVLDVRWVPLAKLPELQMPPADVPMVQRLQGNAKRRP